MKINRDNMFNHSLTMVMKNIRNYLLLSVTIFLSFSLMLGYLVFTDSDLYNSYKEIMGADRNIIEVYGSVNDLDVKKLTTQLDKMTDSHYYMTADVYAKTMYGYNCSVDLLPTNVWGLFVRSGMVLERIKINDDYQISLAENEIIVSQYVYDSLKKANKENEKFQIVFTDVNGKNVLKEYNIIGTYPNEYFAGFDDIYKEGTSYSNIDNVYVSMASVSDIDVEFVNTKTIVYSERPETVLDFAKEYQVSSNDIVNAQNSANDDKRMMTSTKYLISVALFVLLGINLYSSFKNALNERKFEIGVKRAIGASKFNIMLQFIIEGFAVMFVNILISICLILNVSVIYKFVQLEFFNIDYTIMLTTESVMLFAVFSIFLTVVFCLMFAYQSTKVEIIKYLKEE